MRIRIQAVWIGDGCGYQIENERTETESAKDYPRGQAFIVWIILPTVVERDDVLYS